MAILKSLKKGKRPTNPRFSIEQRPKKFDPNTDRLSPGTDLSTAVDDLGVPIFTDPSFDGRKISPPRRLPPSRTPLLPPKYNPNQMSLVQGAPATNQLASIYGGGPSLASLINPPRTDPGGQEDMDKLMEMQRQSFRRFLAPPPEETPPPGTTPPGTTPPGTTPPGTTPPGIPGIGIPGIGIPGIGGIPSLPGIGGIPEIPGIPNVPNVPPGIPNVPNVPPGTPNVPGIGGVPVDFDIDSFRDSIIADINIPQPVIDQEALIKELQGKINIPEAFDPSDIQAQIDALSDKEMVETQAFDPSDIQAQIDALQGGIANLPTFDPTGLQEQIDALSVRDIVPFDPSGIQAQIDALSNKEVPTFDPTGLQEQIDALSVRDIVPFDPSGIQAQIDALSDREMIETQALVWSVCYQTIKPTSLSTFLHQAPFEQCFVSS